MLIATYVLIYALIGIHTFVWHVYEDEKKNGPMEGFVAFVIFVVDILAWPLLWAVTLLILLVKQIYKLIYSIDIKLNSQNNQFKDS